MVTMARHVEQTMSLSNFPFVCSHKTGEQMWVVALEFNNTIKLSGSATVVV